MGPLYVGVPVVRALLFGILIRSSDFRKLPYMLGGFWSKTPCLPHPDVVSRAGGFWSKTPCLPHPDVVSRARVLKSEIWSIWAPLMEYVGFSCQSSYFWRWVDTRVNEYTYMHVYLCDVYTRLLVCLSTNICIYIYTSTGVPGPTLAGNLRLS